MMMMMIYGKYSLIKLHAAAATFKICNAYNLNALSREIIELLLHYIKPHNTYCNVVR